MSFKEEIEWFECNERLPLYKQCVLIKVEREFMEAVFTDDENDEPIFRSVEDYYLNDVDCWCNLPSGIKRDGVKYWLIYQGIKNE